MQHLALLCGLTDSVLIALMADIDHFFRGVIVGELQNIATKLSIVFQLCNSKALKIKKR
jgi:hypothetical protein